MTTAFSTSFKTFGAGLLAALAMAAAPAQACTDKEDCVWTAPTGETLLDDSPVFAKGSWIATLISSDTGALDILQYKIKGSGNTWNNLFDSNMADGTFQTIVNGGKDIVFRMISNAGTPLETTYGDNGTHVFWTALGNNTYRMYWEDWSIPKTGPGCADFNDLEVRIAMVPEPGEWAMLLAGIGMVGWMRRRRQR